MIKTHYYVAKGSSPWYSEYWNGKSHVINSDESIPGQATVTCDGKVTDMFSMFGFCTSLTLLDLSNFNTSKVTNMSFMFESCYNLASLNLSNFDTSKVTDMRFMFNDCYNLTTIKGIIDMKSCTSYSNMFYNCPKLKDVKIKNPPSYTDWWKFAGFNSKSQFTIVSSMNKYFFKEVFTLFKFLIHLLGGFTSSEYNQLSLEIDSLNNILAAKNNEIDHLKKESTDLSEKINKLQSQVDSLSKMQDSFIIHVDGGKVWIENG